MSARKLLFVISCKAKDLPRELAFIRCGIGQVWHLDETDMELITLN